MYMRTHPQYGIYIQQWSTNGTYTSYKNKIHVYKKKKVYKIHGKVLVCITGP